MRYRFKPRFRGLPLAAAGVGAGFLGAGIFDWLGPEHSVWALCVGAVGLGVGALFPLVGMRRYEVRTDPSGLSVYRGGSLRMELAWDAITQVVHSPDEGALFVDGGTPEHSILVPGPKVPAPYDIEDAQKLIAEILAKCPADRVETVDQWRGKT